MRALKVDIKIDYVIMAVVSQNVEMFRSVINLSYII